MGDAAVHRSDLKRESWPARPSTFSATSPTQYLATEYCFPCEAIAASRPKRLFRQRLPLSSQAAGFTRKEARRPLATDPHQSGSRSPAEPNPS